MTKFTCLLSPFSFFFFFSLLVPVLLSHRLFFGIAFLNIYTRLQDFIRLTLLTLLYMVSLFILWEVCLSFLFLFYSLFVFASALCFFYFTHSKRFISVSAFLFFFPSSLLFRFPPHINHVTYTYIYTSYTHFIHMLILDIKKAVLHFCLVFCLLFFF